MDRPINILWWILLLITILLVDIHGKAEANVFMDDDDTYEDLILTETPATTMKATTPYNKEGHIITKKSRSHRKFKDFSKLTTSRQVHFKQESLKDVMENMEKIDEKNIIIISSIVGTALLLIIIVSVFLAKAVSKLKHTEKKNLKQAEEGKAQSSDENASKE